MIRLLPVFGLLLGCQAQWTQVDQDGDGYTLSTGDCDEQDPEVHLGATERWYNGIDEDCDGQDADQDGDGFVPDAYASDFPDWQTLLPGHASLTLGDCWDDPDELSALSQALPLALFRPDQVHPGAEDLWYDGVDADCAGNGDFDQDGDGHDALGEAQADGAVGDDCVDGSSADTLFYDCQGLEALPSPDPAAVHPGAEDPFYDGVDSDCDGEDDWDQDADGHRVCAECDDTSADIFPNGQPEAWYDCVDQNCDGNDGDQDGDLYLDQTYTSQCPEWQTLNPLRSDGDCWDDPRTLPSAYTPLNGLPGLDPSEVHPGAEDAPYDGVPADCSEDPEEFDQDGDSYTSAQHAQRDGSLGLDCADEDAAVNPGATERCDASGDEDCDGDTNDPDASGCTLWYADTDGDTYAGDSSACLCEADLNFPYASAEDCDDLDPAVHPGAAEICDEADLDEDCDGLSDDDDPSTTGQSLWYADADGDGYGDTLDPGTPLCEASALSPLDSANDCDDGDANIHPGAAEICDSGAVDEDCDDLSDDADPSATGQSLWYTDADGDGYGDDSDPGTLRCAGDSLSPLASNDDCDDARDDVHPGGSEVCDTADTDEDCDGVSDDDDPSATGQTLWYTDADADGYGDLNELGTPLCEAGALSAVAQDCDDSDSAVYPGAEDTCSDGLDADCDGAVDEGTSSSPCYAGGELAFTELQVQPSADPSHEWFELSNLSSDPISLESMRLTRASDSGADISFLMDQSLLLAPGERAVFCFVSTPLGALCDYEYGASVPDFLLTDDEHSTLHISAQSGGAELTLDSLRYDSSPSPSLGWPSPVAGRSLELSESLLNATDNDAGGSWCLADLADPYFEDSGLFDYGTPGAENRCP